MKAIKICMLLMILAMAGVNAQAQDEIETYRWNGTITGTNISHQVKIAVAKEDSVAIGEIYGLTTSGAPLRVIGTWNDEVGTCQLDCFTPTGKIFAVIRGELGKGKLNGYYYEGKNSAKIALARVGIKPKYDMYRKSGAYCSPFNNNVIYYFHNFNPIYGVYAYSYSDGSGSGTATIKYGGAPAYVLCKINVTLGPPSYNTGKEDCPGKLEGDYFMCYNASCDYSFKVSLYNDFIIVTSDSGSAAGCYGMNVSLEGIYYKVRSLKQK
jgi:hypothetical protein